MPAVSVRKVLRLLVPRDPPGPWGNKHQSDDDPDSDDDDEEGWEAMKAKRDKKKSLWKTKKSIGGDFGAFIR